MDGFVASVVIAALAMIALGGVYSAWRHAGMQLRAGMCVMPKPDIHITTRHDDIPFFNTPRRVAMAVTVYFRRGSLFRP
jgi:hypothetical protein